MPYTEAAKHRSQGSSNGHERQREPRERGRNTGLHYSFLKGHIVLGGRCKCCLRALFSFRLLAIPLTPPCCRCHWSTATCVTRPLSSACWPWHCRAGLEEHPGLPGPHPRPRRSAAMPPSPLPYPSQTCMRTCASLHCMQSLPAVQLWRVTAHQLPRMCWKSYCEIFPHRAVQVLNACKQMRHCMHAVAAAFFLLEE